MTARRGRGKRQVAIVNYCFLHSYVLLYYLLLVAELLELTPNKSVALYSVVDTGYLITGVATTTSRAEQSRVV